MTTRAVLFDLDGTLLDTLADIAWAMNTALEEAGLPPHPPDAYRTMVGWGLRELVRRAVGPSPTDRVPAHEAPAAEEAAAEEAIARRMVQLYAEHPMDRTTPYDGVPDLLASLAERRVPVAILSNKADDLVQAIVRSAFGDGRFAVVRGLADGAPAKPDPTGALAVAGELGVSPRLVLYLGDSDVDMQTARNAGMRAIGAAWGFRGAKELYDAGAEAVIASPLELLGYLGKEGTDG